MRIFATITATGFIASVALMAHADQVLYPAFDGTYTAPNDGIISNYQALSMVPEDHRWIDPDNGAGSGLPKYYGGKLTWTASPNPWGSRAIVGINIGQTLVAYIRGGEGTDGWSFRGDNSSAAITGYPRSTNFTFIIKIEDRGWNTAVAKLFLDAQTQQLIEPTNGVLEVNVIGRTTQYLDMFFLLAGHEGWDTGVSELKLENSYSNYTNWPGIPEPALSILASAAILAICRFRRCA